MAYVPKSKREGAPSVPSPDHLVSEEDAINAMANLIEEGPSGVLHPPDKIITAAMFAAKHTCSETGQRVFVQDFAASLNRHGLLSNKNVQAFREYAYQYMRGFP